MGQQQLLLIILGLIVVGLTIAVGISIAATSSSDANRDAVMSDLLHIGTLARSHYLRPGALRGGGYSFTNFNIPAELDTTGNGTYAQVREGHSSDHIHFEGIGRETGDNGTDPIRMEIRLTINEIRVTKYN